MPTNKGTNKDTNDVMKSSTEELMDQLRQMQSEEESLYELLQDSKTPAKEKDDIIKRMNELSQQRIKLYHIVKDMHDDTDNGAKERKENLKAQLEAARIIEERLNETKRRANATKAVRGQQLRVVSINTYYGKKYQAYARIMRIIVFTCLPILAVYKAAEKGLVGDMIVNVVLMIALFFGGIGLFRSIADYTTRDPMNFDQYVWTFNADAAPTADETREEKADDIWNWDNGAKAAASPMCVGVACCAEGMAYNEDLNQCTNK
jgi:uncharacterized membrane protein YqaE (UPF0057 family)